MRWPWYFCMWRRTTLIINLQMQMSKICVEIPAQHLHKWITGVFAKPKLRFWRRPKETQQQDCVYSDSRNVNLAINKKRKKKEKVFSLKVKKKMLNCLHFPGSAKGEISEVAHLTGLLVRETLRDSRQLNSFSSVMPDRSSWTYSWDDSVNSCLLFLSPP